MERDLYQVVKIGVILFISTPTPKKNLSEFRFRVREILILRLRLRLRTRRSWSRILDSDADPYSVVVEGWSAPPPRVQKHFP